jgi:iron complex transport system substrate-binding protein
MLVGVTVNDDYPEEVRRLPKVGDIQVDLEKLLSLKPDLVVIDREFSNNKAQLERFGLSVLELKSRRLEDISQNLRALGRRLNRARQGEEAAERFEKRLEKMPKLDSEARVFVEIWSSPLMTVGADSIPDDLLQLVGLSNVYSEQVGYFQVDPEDVVSRRPDIIIVATSTSNASSAAASLVKKAGGRPKVVVLGEGLFTTPSPRLLQGLNLLLQELDPKMSDADAQ